MKPKTKKIAKNNKEKLPISRCIYNKENFEEFCELEIDCNIKSIDRNDLPNE